MKILLPFASLAALASIAAPAQAAEIAPSSAAQIHVLAGTSSAELAKDPPRHARAYGRRDKERRYDRRQVRNDRVYDRRGQYYEPRRVRRGDNVWQGRDGRYYCERGNGTTGLIIGAAGGALVGRSIDTRGDRTLGTLLGGALGAVLGREVDRGSARCR
ncbi:glycine zipper 2TM domain-containing protein [Erythrobacter sp.]|nr:glycine zipper 2TM domain-containing protein [Erythrobacter sp.]